MKRLVSAFLALLLSALCIGVLDAAAAIRIREVGKALNDNPGMTWSIVNGLRVVPRGVKVFLVVDTASSKAGGTVAWTMTGKPSGSAAALDSSTSLGTSFTTDSIGYYYITVTAGSQSDVDSIFAGTYMGVSSVGGACATCHRSGPIPPSLTGPFQDWQGTGHAQIFAQGISGQLEVDALVKSGLYKGSCVQCHTVGWEPSKNNGNFGYVAHWTVTDTSHVTNPGQKGWDSTWFAGLPLAPDGSGNLFIPTDPTRARFHAMPANMQALGTIGCESCHGPLAQHGDFNSGFAGEGSVAISYSADLCNQCHNGSTRHTIGTYFNMSVHAKYPPVEPNATCAPCHQGYSIVKWSESGKDTTGWASTLTADQLNTPIACVACHDPHKAATINADGTLDPGLRDLSVGHLRNGYQFTPPGASEVCSFCHSSRYSVTTRVLPNSPPYYGITSRFGPHDNPQYDMFVGSNGYQFGDTSFTGVNTHMGLADGCVTCHMQDRVRITNGKSNNNPQANHSMSMTDTAYGFNPRAVCTNCHGSINDYNDVKAFYDFDRNGRIEGVQTEIQGLLNQVFAILPKDTVSGVVSIAATGSKVTHADSVALKNRLDLVAGIWNYQFVSSDGSMGVHNAEYAARLLYKTLGWTPLWVKDVPGAVPTSYTLDQNYPNPFNPSTVIRFSLPKESPVKLQVFDITGALVKTLLDEAVRPGNKEVVWDGTNQAGMKVASGMYLYRLESENFVAAKKMLLLK
ncbi:MAG TPA: T9SS type A sorting domain-containing protein [Bacteroidota bacterium]|nr:T9SS type A sorting domain-containing protein [Bacteroidota bacterium]